MAADAGYSAGQPSYLNIDYRAGPLTNLQPNLYWACMMNNVGDQNYLGAASQPCLYNQYPGVNSGGTNMAFTFNFADGFQGTTESNKQNFVRSTPFPEAADRRPASRSQAGIRPGIATPRPLMYL
jgi:hypothetical protein